MNNQQTNTKVEKYNLWLNAKSDDGEIPDWKRLDIVMRQWAVMSQFESDQSEYLKMKELYQ